MGHASPSSTGADGRTERPQSLFRQRFEAWVLAVSMVVAFAGGFVFRGLESHGSTSSPAPAQLQTNLPTLAPPLDAAQLEGGLPSNHPPIDEGSVPGTDVSTSTTATDGASTTSTSASAPAGSGSGG